MDTGTFPLFGKGRVTAGGSTAGIDSLPWKAHKDFDGVRLKSLVPEEGTGGAFSCLLVRIDPGRAIGRHTHPASIELHEVIAGHGTCLTERGAIAYAPGSLAVLDANSPHEVRAGEDGLCLFATFITVTG